MPDNRRYTKLSEGDPNNTIIMAGNTTFTISQLEEEIDANSEIGRKLKTIEKELEKY